MKTIKFRVWDQDYKKMIYPTGLDWEHPKKPVVRYWSETKKGTKIGTPCHKQLCDIMQFTGLNDKNGKEIYEGDIIRFRRPYRSTQTHTGDNIPNGSYTEPMEPEIETTTAEVMYKDGMFGIETPYDYSNELLPLTWLRPEYDEDTIKSEIAIGKPGWDIWDSPDEGDLQYLLESYQLKDVNELVEYCNVFEIIGNIHQNPELLKDGR